MDQWTRTVLSGLQNELGELMVLRKVGHSSHSEGVRFEDYFDSDKLYTGEIIGYNPALSGLERNAPFALQAAYQLVATLPSAERESVLVGIVETANGAEGRYQVRTLAGYSMQLSEMGR